MHCPTGILVSLLLNLVEYIRNYTIPPEKEDYDLPVDDMEGIEGAEAGPSGTKSRSNLRLIPPPVFTRQLIPQIYKYVLPFIPRLN